MKSVLAIAQDELGHAEMSTSDYFAQCLRLCERADELGYHSGYEKMVDAIKNLTGDKMIESHTALVGTPDDVVEQLRFHRHMFGPKFR